MPLAAGTRIGAYEALGPLGVGGMGEVYRARDTRLDRMVAIKVLPAHLAEDAGLRARFEREAKAVAALSHPHILAIHDFGTHDGIAYAVMELLEGQTLRERLEAGPLPVRKAVELASQTAQGLAAAHDKGVVHRDLKPENLFLTSEGRIKILDFGLARHDPPRADDDRSPTVTRETDPGTVLGTVGYMSPEQVRGATVDHRSDIFSLGCVVYEMLTGVRAFRHATAAETMTAILREEPPELPDATAQALPAVERIVRHCLEKAPSERFQSARDLAFDLDAALQASGRSDPLAGRVRPRRRLTLGAVVATIAIAATFAGGYAWGRRQTLKALTGPAPVFTRLSFGRGTIRSARFAPDGRTVIYAAAWDAQPIRPFLARVESAVSKALPLGDAELLSVSSTGELAVSLGHHFEGWMGAGTLARAPMLGAAGRPIAEGVREADWSPDGSALAVVRRVGDRERLEFPMGKALYDTAGYISHIRLSPRGDRIAFADHPLWADDAGSVAVVDLAGKKTTLTGGWISLRGIAWSPPGDEIWFTANAGSENMALRAVELHGTMRPLLSGLTHHLLFDISREGRVLLGRETYVRHLDVLTSQSPRPLEIPLREQSVARYMTPDGRAFLVTDQAPKGYQVYLYHADGSPPIALGVGDGYCLSPDGKWALAVTPDPVPHVWLHPTGAGESRELANPDGVLAGGDGRWLPDGSGVVIVGPTASHPSRGYLFPLDGSPPRPVTSAGAPSMWDQPMSISPNGDRIVLRDEQGRLRIHALDGTPGEVIRGLTAEDRVIGWTEEKELIFVARREGATWHVRRHDLRTGRGTPWTDIVPADTAGLRLSSVFMTPSGKHWLHSYSLLLTDLYIAEGLR
jgi:eukaryotic-like serine/threonine-protein kinase